MSGCCLLRKFTFGGFLACFLVWSWAALGQAEENLPSENGNKIATELTTEKSPDFEVGLPQEFSDLIVQIVDALESLKPRDDYPEKTVREIADLKAQQEMAEWAFWMMLSSFAAVIVTAVGVVYVALTLKATREAVQEAEVATKAAQDSVEATEKSAVRQLRAYVYVDHATITNLSGKPKIKVKIKNFGQTPAYSMQHWAAVGFQPYPLPENLKEPEDFIPAPISDLPPGHDHTSPIPYDRLFSNDERESLRTGENGIYVVGRIAYRDVYDEPRITNYCLFIGGPIGLKEQLAAYDYGNYST